MRRFTLIFALALAVIMTGCNLTRNDARDIAAILLDTDASATPTALPSATPTATPTVTATPAYATGYDSLPPCYVRTDWPIYVVVRGDTLYRIARRTGVTVDVLMAANCLTNRNLIHVGQQLRVPVVLAPTLPAPPTPPSPWTAYVNGYGEYGFSYAANWYIQGEGEHVRLTSFDPTQGYPSDEAFDQDPNLLQIEFLVNPTSHSTLSGWIDAYKASMDPQYLRVVYEQWRTLPGTSHAAVRLQVAGISVESGKAFSRPEFFTLIGGNIIAARGRGALFDNVIATLRALHVDPPGGEVTPIPPSPTRITYHNDAIGFAFDYPVNWPFLDEVTYVAVRSYNPAYGEPAQAAFGIPGMVKAEFTFNPHGQRATLDAWMQEYRANHIGGAQIAAEYPCTLPDGTPAVRLDMASGSGVWMEYHTVINGNVIQVVGMGSVDYFDMLVNTVRRTTPDAPPTPTVPPSPTPAQQTYTSAAGYAFDYPTGWFVRDHGAQVILTSYDPAAGEPAHAAFADPALVRVEFVLNPQGQYGALDAWLEAYRASLAGGPVETPILAEQPWYLGPGNIPAVRMARVGGTGGWPELHTVFNGNVIQVIGLGNETRFDQVAATLRPAP